jgi:hypothetical protein
MPSSSTEKSRVRRTHRLRMLREGRLLELPGTPRRVALFSALPRPAPGAGVTLRELTRTLDRAWQTVHRGLEELEAAGMAKRNGFAPPSGLCGTAPYLWTQADNPRPFGAAIVYPKARHQTLRVLFPLLDLPATAEELFNLIPDKGRPRTLSAIHKRLRGLHANRLISHPPNARRGEWVRTPLWEDLEKSLPPLPEIE